MRSSFLKFLGATAVVLALGMGDVVHADDECLALTRAGGPGVAASPERSGDFAGTIVNLSCDFVRPSGGAAHCDDGEHYFALKIGGQSALYPLLFAHDRPSDRLRAGVFTGKQVRISGVRSSSTGAILVSDIHPLG